ncbi:MAG: BCD family MFS transporter [Betaproteobacteria bacterium]
MNLQELNRRVARLWERVPAGWLPFADAATEELPLGRLLRLALFQVSVGMATALLVGTLNRVMIVELGIHAWVVALMAALPIVFAPFRALVGFRSDTYRSVIGWRRVPFIWMGTMMQFSGLAIMPFALLVLTGQGHGPAWIGQIGAAAAFLLVGAGVHTTQTAGLALATDLAPPAARPRVVALMYVMLLLGMVVSAFVFSALLSSFRPTRLVQVVQGAAALTMVLNVLALWKQEARIPAAQAGSSAVPLFGDSWRAFAAEPRAKRFLLAVGLGTAAFSMQDIVLEPYGGEILHLSVGETSLLTALLAGGALVAFWLAARWLGQGRDEYRLAALGVLVGIAGFSCVTFAAPFQAPLLFRIGTTAIGFGGGLFAVATLTAAMGMERQTGIGLALGAWGAVQATAGGVAIAAGGALRDVVSALASKGALGVALNDAAVGYGVVYYIEIALLFATLIALGTLVRRGRASSAVTPARFGLAEFPG